ncbi:MAG: sulfur reduction protein DsrJ [Nitrospinae bacterium]|nr:sulfur reduction protein DsrJ [Nitrospinota bacterium]
MSKTSGVIAVAVLMAVLGFPFIYNAASVGLFTGAAAAPSLTIKKDGKKCVKDPEWMRHNHMKFLLHTREEAVREGIREEGHGIAGCRSCHPNRAEFCDKCHGYVGVKPECWNCHYYPATAGAEAKDERG